VKLAGDLVASLTTKGVSNAPVTTAGTLPDAIRDGGTGFFSLGVAGVGGAGVAVVATEVVVVVVVT